jgi:hypothetical protein
VGLVEYLDTVNITFFAEQLFNTFLRPKTEKIPKIDPVIGDKPIQIKPTPFLYRIPREPSAIERAVPTIAVFFRF